MLDDGSGISHASILWPSRGTGHSASKDSRRSQVGLGHQLCDSVRPLAAFPAAAAFCAVQPSPNHVTTGGGHEDPCRLAPQDTGTSAPSPGWAP